LEENLGDSLRFVSDLQKMDVTRGKKRSLEGKIERIRRFTIIPHINGMGDTTTNKHEDNEFHLSTVEEHSEGRVYGGEKEFNGEKTSDGEENSDGEKNSEGEENSEEEKFDGEENSEEEENSDREENSDGEEYSDSDSIASIGEYFQYWRINV
jgi:hypothetical protein